MLHIGTFEFWVFIFSAVFVLLFFNGMGYLLVRLQLAPTKEELEKKKRNIVIRFISNLGMLFLYSTIFYALFLPISIFIFEPQNYVTETTYELSLVPNENVYLLTLPDSYLIYINEEKEEKLSYMTVPLSTEIKKVQNNENSLVKKEINFSKNFLARLFVNPQQIEYSIHLDEK